MRKSISRALAPLALAGALLLSACGSVPAPNLPPAPTAPEAAETPAPTPTPAPTSTPAPTATPAPVRSASGYDFSEPAEFTFRLSDMRMTADDGSTIAWSVSQSDAPLAARTREEYLLSLAESYAADGLAADDILLEEYGPCESDGAQGFQAVYTLRTDGTPHVLERAAQAGDTVYRLRFVDRSGSDVWMDVFRLSANTIDIRWDDEPDARERANLVLYHADGGFAICMPKQVSADTLEGYSAFLYGDEYMMSALREGFEDYAALGMDTEDFTLWDYAALIEEANGMAEPFAPDAYGNPAATYTNTVASGAFFYYSTVRKGPDAFWVVSLACEEGRQDEYAPQFALWADSIQLQ